jgi:hypothetical protein
MRLLPVFTFALIAAPAWTQIQDSWVVPAAFATTNASTTNSFPFTYTNYVRLQQAIDPATMGVPRNIHGMAFRPRAWGTAQQQPFTVKMSIKLSFSAKAVNQLDGVYGNNVKGTQVEVWNGPVYFHTPTANNPNEFSATIWFQKSFLYIGTDPILIDMVPLDACAGGGDSRGSDFDPTSTGMGCVLGKNKNGCGTPIDGGFQQAGGFVIKFFGSALMPYGLGCKGSNGVPLISSTGGPPSRGNASFAMVLGQGKASSAALLFLGFNRDNPPFPIDLTTQAMPGCWLWADPLLMVPTATDASGAAQFGLPIPNAAGLANLAFFVQWFVADAAANPRGISASPGGAVVIR